MPIAPIKPAVWTPPLSSPEHDTFWQALVQDSAAAVAVVDGEGMVLYANALYLRMMGVGSIEEIEGLTVEQRLGQQVAEERMPIMRRVMETGRPVVLRDLRRGRAVLVTMRKIPGMEAVLGVFRPADVPGWVDAQTADVPVTPVKHLDLGPIAVLSEREKEILAFIGQGMTSSQIAKRLHRTIKTIEWHRSAIARKLHTKDRVALSKIAIQAGLCTPEFNSRLNAVTTPTEMGEG